MTTKQKALGTTLSWISVSDIDKAKELFINTLGMEINSETPEYGWLEVKGPEGSIIGVGKADKEMPAGQNAIICIDCENIEEMIEHMKSKSVQFHGEIIEVPNEVKMILFSDQDGNKFHLVQQLSKDV